MRITIEGNQSQIKGACQQIARALRGVTAASVVDRTPPKTRQRREQLLEIRRVLRRAYDLIRRDPQQKKLVTDLARALGGSAPITEDLLDEAAEIIATRGEG